MTTVSQPTQDEANPPNESKESSDISQSLWSELCQKLSDCPLIEDEEDNTYVFEPYPPVPLPLEKLKSHDVIPNAKVSSDIVDPEESFRKFLGKTIDLTDVDFSTDELNIKPRSNEVVHGWSTIVKESFCERLNRLRAEIPEVVSALTKIKGFPTEGKAEKETIFAKRFLEFNQSLADIRGGVEQKATNAMRETKGYQRATFGAENCPVYLLDGINPMTSDDVSIYQLLNPYVTCKEELTDQIGAASLKTSGVTATLDLKQSRKIQRSEFVRKLDELERRLQFLLGQTKTSSQTLPDNNTLKDNVERLMQLCQVLDTPDRKDDEAKNNKQGITQLELQLQALQANRELLEGVQPRPDSEESKLTPESKYFSNLNAWDPDKRIEELVTLSSTNKGCTIFVDQILKTLSEHSPSHQQVAETAMRLKQTETLQSDLKLLTAANLESLRQIEVAVSTHQQQLQDTTKTLLEESIQQNKSK